MRRRGPSFIERRAAWWTLLAVLPALWHLIALAIIFASRIRYGFDVEWMEGGALLHAHRLLHGLPLYGEPGKGFMPYPYPPFHALVLAAAGAVFGLDFSTGRAVSILATTVAGGLLAREVYLGFRPLGKPLFWAIVAAGLVAAAFPITMGWYDVIRNDMLALALPVVAGAWLASGATTLRAHLGVAALLTAAVLTKQTTLVALGWLALWAVITQGRRGLRVGAFAIAGVALVVVALRIATHDRFWFYSVTVISKHHVDWSRALEGLKTLVAFAPHLWISPVVAVGLLAHRRLSPRTALWTGMLLAAFPMALLPYAKVGGFPNNFTPVVFLCGPVALLLAADLLRALRPAALALGPFVLAGALDLYLLHRTYKVRDHVITLERHRAAQALTRYLRDKGPRLTVPMLPFTAIRAGAEAEAIHTMPWIDARWSAVPGLDFRGYLRRAAPEWIMLTGTEDPFVIDAVMADYDFVEAVPPAMAAASTTVASFHHLVAACRRRPTLRRPRPVFTFEQGDLASWERTGQAFEITPTSPHGQGRIFFAQGRRVLNSFPSAHGDGAKGRAVSPPFLLDRSHLALLVAGGDRDDTRVELQIDGVAELRASGSRTEMMRRVVWDVSRWSGKQARIVAVDDSSGAWGHLVLDDVVLFDGQDR